MSCFKATFVRPRGHHAVRKMTTAARKHGVTLKRCTKDRFGYHVTCEIPCSQRAAYGRLPRTKRLRKMGITSECR